MTPTRPSSGIPQTHQSHVPNQFVTISVGSTPSVRQLPRDFRLLMDTDPKMTVLDLINKIVKEKELDDTQDYQILFAGKRMQHHLLLEQFCIPDKTTVVYLASSSTPGKETSSSTPAPDGEDCIIF